MESETKQGRLAIIRRLSLKRRQRVVVDLVQDFAQNSTLHGLRYVAERGISLAERVFWIAAFVTSLSLCAMLISNVWVKWQTSPIIVTLSEQLVSVGEVPFPAVTICPQSKVKQSVFNDSSIVNALYLQIGRNWTQNDIDRLNMYNAVGLLCGFTLYIQNGNDSDGKLIERLYEVSPNTYEVFESCEKHGKRSSCYDLFSPVLTKEGVCFTMNTLASDEILRVENVKSHDYYLNTSTTSKGWSFLKGYYSGNDSDVYPERGRSKGDEPCLDITLTERVGERSIQCNIFEDGFKVYLHHPADMPQTSVYYSSALPGEAVSLAVKLSVLNTSSNLKDYPPEKRQCYFPEERQLRYFLTYTTRNCMLECQTNFTLEECRCVEFYMPHSMNSTICKGQHVYCTFGARTHYADNDGLSQCQCLPLCNDIHYEAEILKSKFNMSRYVEHLKSDTLGKRHASLFENLRFTKLLLYYKAPQFMSMRRSEMFGLTDFLANCGGLLGLFLGFSFLSLVEIVYFLTLRLGCSLRRDQPPPDNIPAKY